MMNTREFPITCVFPGDASRYDLACAKGRALAKSRISAVFRIALISVFLLSSIAGVVLAGSLKIVTRVSRCDIYLNDIKKGASDENGNFLISDLEPGSYSVEVVKQGYERDSKTVNVSDLVELVEFDLKTSSGESNPNLILDGNIAGVTVFVDGRPAGITGDDAKLSLSISSGAHKIEFRLDGYQHPPPVLIEAEETIKKISFTMESIGEGSADLMLLFWVLVLATASILGVIIYLLLSRNKDSLFHNRYLLRGVIGRGGMSTIYRAKDKSNNKIVALKVMDPVLTRDPDLLKKFLREGESVQMLNQMYPSAPIVKVFEYGRELGRTNGRPFIAMEYLAGKDLLAYLHHHGKLTIGETKGIILEVLRALQAAHSQGIYHRDLAPDNIIIGDDKGHNIIHLIDFGVARHEYTSAGTLDGSITGKPPYMSPEQCHGLKVDGRSDIYSLGIIFYTLLTGAPPFVSQNPLEVMRKHESEPVPPLPESIPADVATVVYQMLEKDPSKRFANVSSLMQVLQGI